MKVAALEAPYLIRLEERPLPALPPGWALINVQAAGICGSDVHFYTGELPAVRGSVRGHEIAGVVVDPGDTDLSRDCPVVVHPLVGCGLCAACRRGEQQLCVDLQGIGGQYAGGFAEFVAVPASNLYPFDFGLLPFRHAALADCVAVAVHAANSVRLKAHESAVILGDGTIGLLLLQVALARGARPVILVGKHERNLELARGLGASLVLAGSSEDPLPAVRAAAGEVDVVFEAVGGVAPPLEAGLKLLRKGGRLAILGLTGSRELCIPWLDVVFGERTLVGVMGYGLWDGKDEMQEAIDLMQSGQIVLEPLITDCVGLDQLDQGFAAMLNRAVSQSIKVMVLPAVGTN